MSKERREIDPKDCWNVALLYPSIEAWEESLKKFKRDSGTQLYWKEIASYRNRLKEGPSILKQVLEEILEQAGELERLYTYAHLRHDEDIANDQNKSALNKITSLMHQFHQEVSWFEPELLSLPESVINSYLNDPLLAGYRFHLEKIVRVKKHTLPPEQESLMALSGQALQASHKAFSAINDADFQFGVALDSEGKERELTHASYSIYIRSHDRTLRENSFKKFHGKYMEYENTLTELLHGQVQAHLFNARSRGYSSCLEAALFPKNIDLNVYHALIQAVNQRLSEHHKYVELRKKVLQLEELHLYDMQVPLTPQLDIKMSYKEAEEMIIESVAPLGAPYQNALRKGLLEKRWVDRYENKNKRSGAYSSGCYYSQPYILMNYKDLLRDVFTLAHEAGHSMHSLLSKENQPYHYADYPIFLAEVASTFNEELLLRYLLERAQSEEEKVFLINQKIEDIRNTLFRQTMFAEFELDIHKSVEEEIPLTPRLLKEKYLKLNQKYFGPQVIFDTESEIEWARIPHFYYNFYVFQYATGISAALALVDRVWHGGEVEREDYLTFLKGGCSRYPIEMLKSAGIDLSSPDPVHQAIDRFGELVTQLRSVVVPVSTI